MGEVEIVELIRIKTIEVISKNQKLLSSRSDARDLLCALAFNDGVVALGDRLVGAITTEFREGKVNG